MNGRELYDHLQKHKLLDYLGAFEATQPIRDELGVIVVAALPDRFRIHDKCHDVVRDIPMTDVSNHQWDELESVLTGKRRGKIMRGITRVVGYYAQVRNFNRSKVAELVDRGNGDYAVPAKTPDLSGEISDETVAALVSGGAEMSCKIGKAPE